MKPIYLDYAAATPLDGKVLAAMEPYFADAFYNPSATYLVARRIHRAIETARATVSQTLGAKSAEIVFTAGGTEANNLAIAGVMDANPGKKLVISAIEHESVLALASRYHATEASVSADGIVQVDELMKLVDDDTTLISVQYANNEVGTIQPIHELATAIAEVNRERRKAGSMLPLYLHTDATQAANYLDLHVSRLGVDLMTLNGGKIYGPKQTGALYVRTGATLRPQLQGGGQEGGLRSGTENVPGIVGFAAALQQTQAMRHDEARRLQNLQQLFFKLIAQQIPSAITNGSTKKRLPNNIHITLPGQDNERVLMMLDEMGIMAAAGSACAASNDEPSHVLRAMGITETDAQSSLRFTMGRETQEVDVRRTVDALVQIIA